MQVLVVVPGVEGTAGSALRIEVPGRMIDFAGEGKAPVAAWVRGDKRLIHFYDWIDLSQMVKHPSLNVRMVKR